MDFKFFCQSCGRKLSAEEEMRGSKIECPVCRHEISVPLADANSHRPRNEKVIPTPRPPRKLTVSEDSGKISTGNGSPKQQPSGKQLSQRENNSKISTSPLSSKPAYRKKKSGGRIMRLSIFIILIVGGVGLFMYWKNKNATEISEPAIVEAPVKSIPEKPKLPEKPQTKEAKERTPEAIKKEPRVDYKFNTVKEKEVKGSNAGVCKVEYGNFEIEANLYRNKTVKAHYGIPLGEDGKPLPTASNVVFACPYLPERNFLVKPEFTWYPEVAGYTFFSIDIVSDMEYSEDKTHEYTLVESGFHDLVFKIKKILEQKYGLEDRNILLTGQSAGSCMAEEFVIHYHDKVDASACNGGYNNIHFKKTPSKKLKTAYLINNTAGDWYAEKPKDNSQLQILRLITPPIWKDKGGTYFHHTASPVSWNLIHLFIKGVVELRAKNGGVPPFYKEWPYKQKNSEGKTLYFPSEEFQKEWNKIPTKILEELKYNPKEMAKRNIYFIPAKPSAVVIYIHAPAPPPKPQKTKIYISDDDTITVKNTKSNETTLVTLQDTLYFLYARNVIACSVKISKDRKQSVKKVVALLKEVMRKKEWRNLPIYVCGVGMGGEMAAVAALRYGEIVTKQRIEIKKNHVTFFKTKVTRDQRVKNIITINSIFNDKISYLSIRKARSKSKVPLVMLYSKDFKKIQPKRIPQYTKIKAIPVEGYTLGKRWFNVFKNIAAGNKEISK